MFPLINVYDKNEYFQNRMLVTKSKTNQGLAAMFIRTPRNVCGRVWASVTKSFELKGFTHKPPSAE